MEPRKLTHFLLMQINTDLINSERALNNFKAGFYMLFWNAIAEKLNPKATNLRFEPISSAKEVLLHFCCSNVPSGININNLISAT